LIAIDFGYLKIYWRTTKIILIVHLFNRKKKELAFLINDICKQHDVLQELRQKHEETIVKTELALILKSIREDNVYFIQDKLKTDLPLLERWYLQLKSEMVYKKPREIVQPKLNIKKSRY